MTAGPRSPVLGRVGDSTRTAVRPGCGPPNRSGPVGEPMTALDPTPRAAAPVQAVAGAAASRAVRFGGPAGRQPASRTDAGIPEPRIYFASTSHRRNSNAPGAVT